MTCSAALTTVLVFSTPLATRRLFAKWGVEMGRREREREREREMREKERRREKERERDCVLSGEWRCEGLEGKVKKQEKTKKRRIIIKEIMQIFL